MSRRYSVPYSGTLTAAGGDTDLLSVQPAANKSVRLVGWKFGQTSEVSDAAEESVRITIRRLAATFTVGTGGSAVTPVLFDGDDTAAGFTARCNDTTVSTTSGANTICEELAWNERNTPYTEYWPDSTARWRAVNGAGLVVRCESTVADDISICITFDLEED